jgi:hypothetical protein
MMRLRSIKFLCENLKGRSRWKERRKEAAEGGEEESYVEISYLSAPVAAYERKVPLRHWGQTSASLAQQTLNKKKGNGCGDNKGYGDG